MEMRNNRIRHARNIQVTRSACTIAVSWRDFQQSIASGIRCEKAANIRHLSQNLSDTQDGDGTMSEPRLSRMVRHPAVALVCAAVFALVAVALIHAGVAARNRLAAADDPVKISDRALDRTFNRDVAEREIRSALASGDSDLAQSFVALAADRGVAIDPTLAAEVKARERELCHSGQYGRTICVRLVDRRTHRCGESSRDRIWRPVRLRRYPRCRARGHALPDRPTLRSMDFGLAGVGIAITAATYVTAGRPRRNGSASPSSRRRVAPDGSTRSWRCGQRARR